MEKSQKRATRDCVHYKWLYFTEENCQSELVMIWPRWNVMSSLSSWNFNLHSQKRQTSEKHFNNIQIHKINQFSSLKGHRSPCKIPSAVQCLMLTFGSFGSSILALSGTLDLYRYLVELKLKIKIIKNFTTWKWIHRKLTSLFGTFSWNHFYYKINTFLGKR